MCTGIFGPACQNLCDQDGKKEINLEQSNRGIKICEPTTCCRIHTNYNLTDATCICGI